MIHFSDNESSSSLTIIKSTYSKHLLTKSMNKVSLHLNAWDKVLDPGLRLRPFEFVMQRGTPRESTQWWKGLLINYKTRLSLSWTHQRIDGDEWLDLLSHHLACLITPLCKLIVPLRSRPEIVDIRCRAQRGYNLFTMQKKEQRRKEIH